MKIKCTRTQCTRTLGIIFLLFVAYAIFTFYALSLPHASQYDLELNKAVDAGYEVLKKNGACKSNGGCLDKNNIFFSVTHDKVSVELFAINDENAAEIGTIFKNIFDGNPKIKLLSCKAYNFEIKPFPDYPIKKFLTKENYSIELRRYP